MEAQGLADALLLILFNPVRPIPVQKPAGGLPNISPFHPRDC